MAMRKAVLYGLVTLFSLSLIYVLIGQDLGTVRATAADARFVYVFPCLLLLLLSMVTRAVRWHILLDRQIPFMDAFHINNIGFLITGIIPLRAGDLVRAWLVTRLDKPVAGFTVLSTVLVERLFDILAVLLMLSLSLVVVDLPSEVTSVGLTLSAVTGLLIVGLVILRVRANWAFILLSGVRRWIPVFRAAYWQQWLQEIVDGIKTMSRFRLVLAALVWTALSWLCDIFSVYVLLFMMFDMPTLGTALIVTVLAGLSVALPALLGNLGPFEGAVVSGIWLAGLIEALTPPENAPAVVVAVTLHALTLGVYVILGVIGVAAKKLSLPNMVREAIQSDVTRPTTTH